MVPVAQFLRGDLTAETVDEPKAVFMCSCRDCRQKFGSAFSVSTYWAKDAVTITGAAQSWRRSCQECRTGELFHCPTCGVGLCWTADFTPGQIGIGGGNLDDCEFTIPKRAVWTKGLSAWVSKLNQIPKLLRQ